MTLRTWVTDELDSQSSPRWLIAFIVKHLIELLLALFFAAVITGLGLMIFSVDKYSTSIGRAGPIGVLAIVTYLIFDGYTHCKYTDLN
jgi:hypothetical protein